MKNLKIYVIRHGQRVRETAGLVCETLGISGFNILDELIERDFGEMTGKPIKDIEKICSPYIIKTDLVTYFLKPKGAETFPKLMERASKIITLIKERHERGNILLCCHGDIGKMLYANYYGVDWEDVLKSFHFENAEMLILSENTKKENAHVFKIKQENH